jgi:hypothetical protein
MKNSYRATWTLILLGALAASLWTTVGRAALRRTRFAVPLIAEASRTEARFVAVLLPHVTGGGGRYSMSGEGLAAFLAGLKTSGSVSVSLGDIRDFYAKRRLLPPHAVLIAFAENSPMGQKTADAALKKAGLRAVDFISGIAASGEIDQRQLLSAHAVGQMRLGGAWEIAGATSAAAPGAITALLDATGGRSAQVAADLVFASSELGFNDAADDPKSLHILAIRPDRAPAESVRVVADAWPREKEFVDDFSADGLGPDWISGWGSVSAGRRRLMLLPTPRQTGAGVFLRGTEKWSDVVLEFDLRKYEKEFWAYVRYSDDGGFLRVGARNGYWYVEQKTGPKNLPSMLARAPILELPAHVRLVLKEGAAIVHVNGRMQFGKALRVSPAVSQGRVLFGVYDVRPKSALALVTSVRARPGARRWIAWKEDGGRGFDEGRLDGLRDEAVYARAITPRWIEVAPAGAVSVIETQGTLTRSLAGFYSCRLVPMVVLPSSAGALLTDPAAAERLLAGLDGAERGLDAAGLNVRLRLGLLARPETLQFLGKLRSALRARHRELWITLDGGGATPPGLYRVADGVLRPSRSRRAEFELLEAAPRRAPGRAQWETASIQ